MALPVTLEGRFGPAALEFLHQYGSIAKLTETYLKPGLRERNI